MKNIKSTIKYLSFGLKSKAGINFRGRKTIKTKSSGRQKRRYRILDFYKNYNSPFLVIRIEYDPNRSAYIALVCFRNGLLCYILATENLESGIFISNNLITSGVNKKIKYYKYGDLVSSLELLPNFGAKVARAAGTFCVILHWFSKTQIIVRFPSGEEKILSSNSKATFGIISNLNHKFRLVGKAGRSYLLGKKPSVRGVAKNCVDHPHGGGRGRTSKLPVPSNFSRRVLQGVSSKLKNRPYRLYKSRKKINE